MRVHRPIAIFSPKSGLRLHRGHGLPRKMLRDFLRCSPETLFLCTHHSLPKSLREDRSFRCQSNKKTTPSRRLVCTPYCKALNMATAEEISLAILLAEHLKIRRTFGGWLQDARGQVVCQSWETFWQLAVRQGWIIRSRSSTWLGGARYCDGWRIDWRRVGCPSDCAPAEACRCFPNSLEGHICPSRSQKD